MAPELAPGPAPDLAAPGPGADAVSAHPVTRTLPRILSRLRVVDRRRPWLLDSIVVRHMTPRSPFAPKSIAGLRAPGVEIVAGPVQVRPASGVT
ncbi:MULTISPECIES: hypothetical protein [unclassified Streptomyces]|uniref:hypothetical protein n=1 Tax=unclassified Streptomyces TaxID=2593676 RepID=UPI00190906E7|nr:MULTISPECIES: hypothetical protein [unclassified Streptomyces]MBK3563575.1 hypothetical protein [Streptomyces sp. MBT62]MBK6012310.1 hypothetical protein [Streptomyces sp. MBT53]